ncbi:Homoserine dehydrogenase family protein [Leishmania donovani]|uniref:Homoserine dehydrogenase n=3 Tax=Leishmania donovani species complex TaxID=38574 RepID=A0A6L0WSP8_LEIIN|nr:homoserine dehydrogenase-like protein [Leishmania infantum JPCM5]XP_003858483.1 homoserine dehydrogenase-like protein [Leishmania donovani]CAC9448139.1 homoserine_dehydrogenase-like_protein [Leishmania infantum]AYU76195.1 homoserine dehydrogenase-like protein [Leishmania donovani]QTU69560.1 homoserine dehydrogenase [Leishmania donovani]TPP40878.1 Homoserine dehydrogenase family protein [Leishmania donovani]TPP52443.1 Homoserine dehydrogenase family protein [Leishmania donovani]|eukprot:XP_001463235.1 homoserine dehydrogenase-like protein [Leishmania infantum JPCM5]
MTVVRAALLGFGTVGQGIYSIAQQRREQLKQRLGGVELVIVKILVRDLRKRSRVLPDRCASDAKLLTDDIEDVFRADVQVIFEATVGEEPAFTYLQRAIVEHGCSVITANKVMFARYGAALQELAASCTPTSSFPATRVYVGFEATVAAGVPIIKTLQNMCHVQQVRKIEGIVNGTSNYILTELREHPEKTFEEVLKKAQELGYAEADPTNDVAGQDAFVKLLVMVAIAFGHQPSRSTIPVTGIDTLTPEMLQDARAKGLRYRHVVSAAMEGAATSSCAPKSSAAEEEEAQSRTRPLHERLTCSVKPMLLGPEHPLYHMDGTTSAVSVWTDYLGVVTISGPGAGMYCTASAMMEDYAVWMEAFRRP